jgi:hypothetical protein
MTLANEAAIVTGAGFRSGVAGMTQAPSRSCRPRSIAGPTSPRRSADRRGRLLVPGMAESRYEGPFRWEVAAAAPARPDAVLPAATPGYLAYLDSGPVGWVGVGIRSVMPRLANSRTRNLSAPCLGSGCMRGLRAPRRRGSVWVGRGPRGDGQTYPRTAGVRHMGMVAIARKLKCGGGTVMRALREDGER